jgi:hypothetical protein
MPRGRPTPAELWGTYEVAEALGVHSQNLVQIAGLPGPVQKIRATPLWDAAEVREFAEEYWSRRERRLQQALERHAELVAKVREAQAVRDKAGLARAKQQLARQADALRSKGYRLRHDTSTPVAPKEETVVAA